MFTALKVIHIIALALGGASAVSGFLLPRAVARSGHKGPLPRLVTMFSRSLAIAALIAIVLLWISGIAMWATAYGGVDLGALFVVKLVAATLIFAISLWTNLLLARASRTGQPPDPARMRRLGIAARGLFFFTLIVAVVVFS